MAGIEIVIPRLEPTACIPVSAYQHMTLSSNATTLGNIGFGMGILASVAFYVAIVFVAPRVYHHGLKRGWW